MQGGSPNLYKSLIWSRHAKENQPNRHGSGNLIRRETDQERMRCIYLYVGFVLDSYIGLVIDIGKMQDSNWNLMRRKKKRKKTLAERVSLK